MIHCRALFKVMEKNEIFKNYTSKREEVFSNEKSRNDKGPNPKQEQQLQNNKDWGPRVTNENKGS